MYNPLKRIQSKVHSIRDNKAIILQFLIYKYWKI